MKIPKKVLLSLAALCVVSGFFVPAAGNAVALLPAISISNDGCNTNVQAGTFNVGDHLYIYGQNFANSGSTSAIQWSIDGTNYSDANVGGPVSAGNFCIDTAHTIGAIESGTYNVQAVQSFGDTANIANTTYNVTIPVPVDNAPPTTPVHVSPANNSVLTTAALNEIDWTDSTDADSPPVSYTYQAANDPTTNPDGSFVTPVYTSGPLTESRITTTGTAAGVYYWHVKAMDSAAIPNPTPWTDAWKITVDNTPTTLTVNKVVIPSSDTGKFNLQIDGTTAGTGANVGNGGTTGAMSFAYGSVHTVSETAGTDTILSNYASLMSGACAADGTITLAPGNNVCTITNTPIGPVFIDTNQSHTHDSGELYFTTIQAAVDYATAGDFIQATAGTYPEHVIINKSVTINGANWNVAGNGTRAAESIVDGTDTGAPFALSANSVTIAGFTVRNGSGGSLNSGIYSTTGTQGFRILDNVITGNDFGVWAQCGGDCLIDHNLFDGNNKEGPGTDSISADSTTGLTISNNEFKNDTAGNPILLQAVAPGAHNTIIVTGNYFHDNTNASVIYALAINGGTFSNNIIRVASDVTGLSFSGADTNITVTGNTITGGLRAIRVEDAGYYGASGGNSNIDIHNNSITGNTTGLYIVAAAETNVTATFNDLSQNNLAIYFGDVTPIKTLGAENNWFGCAAGPAQMDEEDPTPTSVAICGVIAHDANPVNFTPWLATVTLSGNNPIAGTIMNSDNVAVGFGTGLQDKFASTGVNLQPGATSAIEADNRALYNVNLIGPNPGNTTASDIILFAGQDSTFTNSLVVNTPAAPTPVPVPTPAPVPSGGGGSGGNSVAFTGKMGDINKDGKVDEFDFAILLADWGSAAVRSDLNKDGVVNELDLAILMFNFGK